MKYILRPFSILLFLIISLNADILIGETSNNITLLNKSQIYIGSVDKENIDTLIKKQNLFTSYHKDFINRGFDYKHVIWIKFILKNQTSKTIERVISFRNSYIEKIVLYTVKNQKVLKTEYASSIHRKKFNGIFLSYFKLELPPFSKKIFYMEVSNPKFPLSIKPLLTTAPNFLHLDISVQIAWTFFITVLITVLLYHTLFFIFTRDSIYFYYAFYLTSIFLTRQYLYGLLLHFSPMDDPTFVEKKIGMTLYYADYTAFTIILFIQNFLETKQYPKIHKTLNIILILIIIHFFTIHYNLFSWQSISFFYMLNLFFCFFIGVYALYKKNRYAKYFVIAWGISLLGWTSLTLKGLGIWYSLYKFPYTFETLITIEIFLFSFAISKRMHEVYQEKEKLSKILQNENIRLEKAVNERTKDLKTELHNNEFLLHELHHRVKNNMLFISSLYALKLDDSNDSKLLSKLYDVERKIYAMSEVHEMLYKQKDLSRVNTKEYFKKVLDGIQRAFSFENIYYHASIEKNLQTEDAIYCGLIVNELVTNAVKYAFDEKGGEIYIKLQGQDEKTLLEVSDNGNGKIDTNTSGFGMMMVQTLAKEQLGGELSINTTQGSKISIIF